MTNLRQRQPDELNLTTTVLGRKVMLDIEAAFVDYKRDAKSAERSIAERRRELEEKRFLSEIGSL